MTTNVSLSTPCVPLSFPVIDAFILKKIIMLNVKCCVLE
jgi:hypothetical protein